MNVEFEIKQLSAKDTIESAPRVSHDKPKIPEELMTILENNLQTFENMSETSNQYLTILKGLASFTAFKPDIYWYIWKLMLYLEQYQGIVECRRFSLYDKTLQQAKIRRGEFMLYVPGLEEQRPSICIRDFVDIMPVSGTGASVGEIKYIGENYISIAMDATFKNTFNPDQRFNISFRWYDWESNNLNYVLDKVRDLNLMKMLFPLGGRDIEHNHPTLSWINPNIEENPQQQQAIKSILGKTAQPDPYILFGPPGTGKTSTLIEAILQIHQRNSTDRILICTPSNAASDEIALKLLKNVPERISETAIYRMYSASRDTGDIPEALKPYSNFAGNEAIFPAKEIFIGKKIVIVTLASAIRVYNYELKENHFSYLFIDEAGQAMEPQMLVPFLIMCGYKVEKNGKPHGQIVIAGDPKQLGPSCQSRIAEPILSISMLERLMSWGPYKRQDGVYNPNYVTKLIQNYRCHPTILEVPNKNFYDGELVACGGDHTLRALNWCHLPNKKFPVIFHAVTGQEERESHSPSVFNPTEVNVVMDYIKKLLMTNVGGKIVKAKDIGIVTPYRLQRAKINAALERRKIDDLSVGTVETFQGQERDVIIISTVRSVLYKANGTIHIGFLSNPKRFNVAVTRAKALLIVIGNPKILQYDKYWREFMQYCLDNGAWRGPQILLDCKLSHREIQKHRGKKHEVQQQWNPNENLPVVEDPKSAVNYDATEEEEEEARRFRRRRLPTGLPRENLDNSNASNKTLKDVEDDWDLWMEQHTYSDDDSEENCDNLEDNDDDDGEDDDEDYTSYDYSGSIQTQSRQNDDDDQDDIFMKFRRRMEELEITSSNNSNTS